MKLSLRWLSKYTNAQGFLKDPTKLSDILTQGGLEVEGIVDQAKNFTQVVVGQIIEKNKHPNADSLTLCLVNVGEQNPRRIVCGAKNHNTGDKVVVALPGAVLPGDFAIKVSKIRGEESQGMLCSEKELGLSSESQGILILPASAPVGESFAKYAKLDDVVFDVKVTPNRSDCLSHFGLAREIAGLTGDKYEYPLTPFNEGRESTRKLIKVTVEDAERCPRYAGRIVRNVRVGPSPEWLKKNLEAVGLRSINNVVDITNFVMLELGQPLHAFDLAQLEGPQIVVRKAQEGEPFTTLDNKELKLDGVELVIADAKKAVALAGVMGGIHSGVSENTRDVFIESAYFIPSAVRKSSRRHGIETDSSYRFSRGVDPDGVPVALNRACQLLSEVAQGSVCADHYDLYPRPASKPRIELDLPFISARLGVVVESVEAKRLLERVDCEVAGSGTKLMVNPPAYRSDLKIPEDLGEEIMRLKGFGAIPETLPQLTAPPTPDSKDYTLENHMAQVLSSLGLYQAVNMSLSSSREQAEFYGAEGGALKALSPEVSVQNPLNLELAVLRRGVLPGLIKNAAHNIRHSILEGGLFEIAPVFEKTSSADIREETKPFTETTHVAAVTWNSSGQKSTSWLKQAEIHPFFKLKGLLEAAFEAFSFRSYKFEPLTPETATYLHTSQSAKVIVEGRPVGVMGVLHPELLDRLDFKGHVVAFELNFSQLMQSQPRALRVKALSKFPSVERDVALLCPDQVLAGEVRQELLKAAGPLAIACDMFDFYKGEKLPADQKSMAYRVTYQDPSRTLSDAEVNSLHQGAVQKVCQKLKLTVR